MTRLATVLATLDTVAQDIDRSDTKIATEIDAVAFAIRKLNEVEARPPLMEFEKDLKDKKGLLRKGDFKTTERVMRDEMEATILTTLDSVAEALEKKAPTLATQVDKVAQNIQDGAAVEAADDEEAKFYKLAKGFIPLLKKVGLSFDAKWFAPAVMGFTIGGPADVLNEFRKTKNAKTFGAETALYVHDDGTMAVHFDPMEKHKGLIKKAAKGIKPKWVKSSVTAGLKPGSKAKVNRAGLGKMNPNHKKVLLKTAKMGDGYLEIESISNGMAVVYPWDNPGAKILGPATVPVSVLTEASVNAGWSYSTEPLFIAMVSPNNKPFNIDTIGDLTNIWLDVKGNDGSGSVAPSVKSHKTSGIINRVQEDQGLRREAVVSLDVPKGYGAKYFSAIQKKLGRDWKVEKLSKFRAPEAKQAGKAKRKKKVGLGLGMHVNAVTYKWDGETLTKKELLRKGKSVEVVFMSNSSNPTFHVLMSGGSDSAKVFKITKTEFDKSKLKDTSTKQNKARYFAWQISKLTKNLSMSDAIDYNMWVKEKNPSEEKKIEYLGRK